MAYLLSPGGSISTRREVDIELLFGVTVRDIRHIPAKLEGQRGDVNRPASSDQCNQNDCFDKRPEHGFFSLQKIILTQNDTEYCVNKVSAPFSPDRKPVTSLYSIQASDDPGTGL
jgi:hypothetical protein